VHFRELGQDDVRLVQPPVAGQRLLAPGQLEAVAGLDGLFVLDRHGGAHRRRPDVDQQVFVHQLGPSSPGSIRPVTV
jgi:hypothetical protein